MKKFKEWLTFERQLLLMACIVFISLALSRLFRQGILANIGWILAGLLPILHPVCSASLQSKYAANPKRLRRDSCIGGGIVIFIGLFGHFGG